MRVVGTVVHTFACIANAMACVLWCLVAAQGGSMAHIAPVLAGANGFAAVLFAVTAVITWKTR